MPRFTGSIGGTTSSDRPDRSTIEVKSAVTKKMMYTKFINMITASSIQVDYFKINKDETTYSEHTNNIKNQQTAKHFDLIENFIIYDKNGQELTDKTEPNERTISISLETKQSVVLMNTIYPTEGDHFIMKSQGAIAKPYMVTKVQPSMFLDNEVWIITYSESTMFTSYNNLLDRVVNTYEYVPANINTDRNAIMEKGINESILKAEQILSSINKMYIEQFYDTMYSVLRFCPLQNPDLYFEYYCNALMQDDNGEQVLKYGLARSTLILVNTYGYDNSEADYMDSLYKLLSERLFDPRDCYEPTGDENKNTSYYTNAFVTAMQMRQLIFADYSRVPEYTSKYVFGTRFYFRGTVQHSIMTRFYNSKLTLVDVFNKPSYINPALRTSWIWYEIESPYILPALDMYMDSDYKGIINYVKNKLRRYRPDKYNIDDYFGVPLLLQAGYEAINKMSNKNTVSTYR